MNCRTRSALAMLAVEAKHFLDTKKGSSFLQVAIDEANAALAVPIESGLTCAKCGACSTCNNCRTDK